MHHKLLHHIMHQALQYTALYINYNLVCHHRLRLSVWLKAQASIASHEFAGELSSLIGFISTVVGH